MNHLTELEHNQQLFEDSLKNTPTNNNFKPTILKYAPHTDIAIALNNTKNAKKFIVYKYSIYYKKEPPNFMFGGFLYTDTFNFNFYLSPETFLISEYHFIFGSVPLVRMVHTQPFSK